MPSEEIQAALFDECHAEVDLGRPIDGRFQMGQQRVDFASREVARSMGGCGGSIDVKFWGLLCKI
ncbi:MAG: hypothetical protein ACKOAH_26890, partial [Pirellula sp.]